MNNNVRVCVLCALTGPKQDPALTFHYRNVTQRDEVSRKTDIRVMDGKNKRLWLSVPHFFSVYRDKQPLNHAFILAPLPWSWLSLSQSIFKSFHPSWRSSSQSPAIKDGGTGGKNEQKEIKTLWIHRWNKTQLRLA